MNRQLCTIQVNLLKLFAQLQFVALQREVKIHQTTHSITQVYLLTSSCSYQLHGSGFPALFAERILNKCFKKMWYVVRRGWILKAFLIECNDFSTSQNASLYFLSNTVLQQENLKTNKLTLWPCLLSCLLLFCDLTSTVVLYVSDRKLLKALLYQ